MSSTNKKINVQNREKQFLKIAAKYANNPLLEDIKFLYINNEIKSIRSVESNLNKPIKLKKDGTPYAASVKRLDNIKKQVQKLKAPKKIESETKNYNIKNLSTYNYAGDHIKTLYNKQKAAPSNNLIIQKISFFENGELIKTRIIEANKPIKGKYKKSLMRDINTKIAPGYENEIIKWIEQNKPDGLLSLLSLNSKVTVGTDYTVTIETGTYQKYIEPTDNKKKQVYKNDVENACLFNGCLNFFNSECKKKKTIYNRLIKNSSEYAKPYTEEEIYKICNLTESNIIIKDMFHMKEKVFKPTEKQARYNIPLTNTRYNHVEYMHSNNEEAQEVENLQAYEKIKKEADYYVETFGEVKTLNGNYKIKDSYFSTIWKDWKEQNNYNSLLIDTQAEEMQLINNYNYSMHHFIDKNFIKDNDLYIEIDVIKAYFNFPTFKNYEGLPSGGFINCKCSNKFTFETFKEQNKNGLIGYYEIEILQIKKDKKKLFETLGFIEGKKYVLTTAQIKTLSPYIEIKFLNYSVSQKVNLNFNDLFLTDKENKEKKPYVKAVGLMKHKASRIDYTIKTDRDTMKDILEATNLDSNFNYYPIEDNGLIKVEETKKIIKCGDHMANYIHSLITCEVINQLLNVEDIENNFIGIKLDSIILKKDAKFKILDTFKSKEANIEKMFKENNSQDGYFTSYFQCINYKAPKTKRIIYDLNLDAHEEEQEDEEDEEEQEINFKTSFLPDDADIINNKLILTGKGGSGKSTSILNFFSSVCVVSSCWNLSEAFKLDFPHIENLSIQRATGDGCERIPIKSNVIFCDELTLWDVEHINQVISLYPNKIIILCGDIDYNGEYYQLDSGFNEVLNLDDYISTFQIVKYIKNYRFDTELNLILDNMRSIDNKKELIKYTHDNFKFMKLEDINFNKPFIGLTDTHEDGQQKSEYLKNNFKDIEKNYFVAKTNYNKNEFKGARVEDITKTNNYELKFFHTCHSYQGQTIKDKNLIISISDFSKYEFNHIKRIIYTSTSRAKTREQIIFIKNI
jgi:hypothetical protein